MRKRYPAAEKVNAPAPRAMADRSCVIHNPHGTRSLRPVTCRPWISACNAPIAPTTSSAPNTINHAMKGRSTRRRAVRTVLISDSFFRANVVDFRLSTEVFAQPEGGGVGQVFRDRAFRV